MADVAPGRQRDTTLMGMYLFLASEIMLFGGLFAVALALRLLHPQEVVAASRRLHYGIGAANTVVLLTSSLAVALAVAAAEMGKVKGTAAGLLAAAGLGLGFLALKAVEYGMEIREQLLPAFTPAEAFESPSAHLFMDLYLVATTLHVVHVTVGVGLLAGLAWRVHRRSLTLPRSAMGVEVVGLYWHLVDVIWVFLYPVLYLVR
ncbi:cytochrome c oxidase subunit 3 [Nitrospirillum sp. BR 11164]|uniref:cytochrome c oxidase subunit 3 n=1 Tax=Nitrospirillum sp. BR 11164 TaxID=3104324 RepID=UPI002AFF1231|nr:cytochrome c oxidase subunit 3 [Nitrospirillum sp. BR 11164]MEA1648234.1 cytochrome c oxidase subunit 3 [Nitrospirillum sp. BR 11164]